MGRKKPESAAELPADMPDAPAPAFDAWPPAGWFVGPDEVGRDGRPFRWCPPPENFPAADALDWVARTHRLLEYWDAVDWSWSRANGPNRSALTNAYLLVDDLRRRGLVPQSGLRIFRVEMDDCPAGFEVRELGRVRDWLGRVIGAGRQPAPAPRLSADVRAGTVTLDGAMHHVGDIRAAFVHVLLTAREGVSLKNMEPLVGGLCSGISVSHLERARGKLPEGVQAAVNTKPRHSIKPEYLG